MINKLIIDAICTSIILIALWEIPKGHKGWLIYSFGCLCFLFFRIYTKVYFSAFLEIVAMIIGYRNFLKGKESKIINKHKYLIKNLLS